MIKYRKNIQRMLQVNEDNENICFRGGVLRCGLHFKWKFQKAGANLNQ